MFKKVAIIFILIFSFVSSAQSQILPAKIKSYLNKNYAGWKISPTLNYCGNAKSIVTGDFDGDKKTDYAAKIFKGKKGYIIAFVERKNSYTPFVLYRVTAKEAKNTARMKTKI